MRVEPSTLKGFYSMKSRHVFLMSAGMLVCIVLCVFCGLSWAGCAQDRCCLLTPFHLLLQWLLYVPQTQDTEQRLRNGLLLYYYDTMLDQTKQGMVFVRPYHRRLWYCFLRMSRMPHEAHRRISAKSKKVATKLSYQMCVCFRPSAAGLMFHFQ